jgi:hypothetical protein
MTKSTSIASDHTIQLSDGRIVGVASAGKINDPPVFHFHGNGLKHLGRRGNVLATASYDKAPLIEECYANLECKSLMRRWQPSTTSKEVLACLEKIEAEYRSAA